MRSVPLSISKHRNYERQQRRSLIFRGKPRSSYTWEICRSKSGSESSKTLKWLSWNDVYRRMHSGKFTRWTQDSTKAFNNSCSTEKRYQDEHEYNIVVWSCNGWAEKTCNDMNCEARYQSVWNRVTSTQRNGKMWSHGPRIYADGRSDETNTLRRRYTWGLRKRPIPNNANELLEQSRSLQ